MRHVVFHLVVVLLAEAIIAGFLLVAPNITWKLALGILLLLLTGVAASLVIRVVNESIPDVGGRWGCKEAHFVLKLRRLVHRVSGTLRCRRNGRTYSIRGRIYQNVVILVYWCESEAGTFVLKVEDGGDHLAGKASCLDKGRSCIKSGAYLFERTVRRRINPNAS